MSPEPPLADRLFAAVFLSAPVAAGAALWSVPAGAAAFGLSVAGWLVVAHLYARFPPASPLRPLRLPFPGAWPVSGPVPHAPHVPHVPHVPPEAVSIERTHDGVVFRRRTSWLQPFAAMELTLSAQGVVARSRLRTVRTPLDRLELRIDGHSLRVRSDDGRVRIAVDSLSEDLLEQVRTHCVPQTGAPTEIPPELRTLRDRAQPAHARTSTKVSCEP